MKPILTITFICSLLPSCLLSMENPFKKQRTEIIEISDDEQEPDRLTQTHFDENVDFYNRLDVSELVSLIIQEGTALIDHLIDLGYNFQQSDGDWTPLRWLVANNKPYLVGHLLPKLDSFSFATKNGRGDTLFHTALLYDAFETLEILCKAYVTHKKHAGLHARDSQERSPLKLAVMLRNPKVVDLLLATDKNAHAQTISTGTLKDIFSAAITSGFFAWEETDHQKTTAIAKSLLQASSHESLLRQYFWHLRARFSLPINNFDFLNLFKTDGDKRKAATFGIGIPSFNNKQVAAIPVQLRSRPMHPINPLQLFFTGGPYIISLDNTETNMLRAFQNDTSALEWILSSPRITIRYYQDEQGQTLLHYLIFYDNFEFFKRFLERRQDDGLLTDHSLNTLLHTACFWGKHDFINYLTSNYRLSEQKNMRNQLPILPRPPASADFVDLTEETEDTQPSNGATTPEGLAASTPEYFFEFDDDDILNLLTQGPPISLPDISTSSGL